MAAFVAQHVGGAAPMIWLINYDDAAYAAVRIGAPLLVHVSRNAYWRQKAGAVLDDAGLRFALDE
jgi:hypothetical protein